jgi:hypothetical protein
MKHRDVAIWSTVEPGLGLMAAGGATLRPLFRSFYNLSTNRRSITHPYLPSHPQSRMKSRSSPSSLGGQESIRLRNDIVDPRGTVTSVGSPFGDTYEVPVEGISRFIERWRLAEFKRAMRKGMMVQVGVEWGGLRGTWFDQGWG